MHAKLEIPWAISVLGFISIVLLPIPYLFCFHGAQEFEQRVSGLVHHYNRKKFRIYCALTHGTGRPYIGQVRFSLHIVPVSNDNTLARPTDVEWFLEAIFLPIKGYFDQ